MITAPYRVVFELVNSFVVSVHDTVISGSALCTGLTLGVSLLVHLLGNCVECLLDILGSSLDGSDVGALIDFLQLVNSVLHQKISRNIG